jgi:nucleoside-diphosphate-sugar epimerase
MMYDNVNDASGKQTLLTGANGFLGGYLKSALLNLGEVDTLGRSASTWNVNLASTKPTFDKRYRLVVHNAGKAHVIPRDEFEGQQFFDVNVKGTEHLLQSLELSGVPQAFVFISSVSVYGLEAGLDISESQPLNARDPYGKSKIQAEELVTAWCKKNNVICTILRLPLIVGENAPGNLKTMINSIKKGFYFNIGGGQARKSMVLAQDVADLIVRAAEVGGVYNLTDGHHPNFKELSAAIARQLNKPAPALNLPVGFARLLGRVGDLLGGRAPVDSLKIKKITANLTFNDDQARKLLDWQPTPVLDGLKI